MLKRIVCLFVLLSLFSFVPAAAPADDTPGSADPVSAFDLAFTQAADYHVINTLANFSVDACANAELSKTGDTAPILRFLDSLGFRDVSCYDVKSSEHTSAHFLGWKPVRDEGGETVPLLAVIIRGTNGSLNEWASNLTRGSGKNHEGFELAEKKILEDLMQYADSLPESIPGGLESGSCKVWICGYSRGGACGNLLAADLPVPPQNVYAYLYAVPTPTTVPEDCPNIHNFILQGDILARMIPSWYGWGRHGTVHYLDNPAEMNGADLCTKEEIDAILLAMSIMYEALDDFDSAFERLWNGTKDCFPDFSISGFRRHTVEVFRDLAGTFSEIRSRSREAGAELKDQGIDMKSFWKTLPLSTTAHFIPNYQLWMRRVFSDDLPHEELDLSFADIVPSRLVMSELVDGISEIADKLDALDPAQKLQDLFRNVKDRIGESFGS